MQRKMIKGMLGVLLGAVVSGTGGYGEERVTELAPVEVIGEAEALFRLPGSGYRVDGTVIEDYQLDDINRLLQRVPGVYIREEDGFGLLANISLRGVDLSRASKLTLMEDGIPTAPAPYSAPAAYYTPTLGRMSGVEILKGTSQVRHGPHTTGGVINYLSTPLAGDRGGYLRLSGGSDGEMQAHGWFGERLDLMDGKLDLLMEVNHRENDGFMTINPAGEFAGSDATGFERTEGMFKAGWSSEDGRHRLEFKIGGTDLRADISYLGVSEADFSANPFQRYAASREDVLNTEHVRSYLRYGLRLSNSWDLSWVAYTNTFHRNWFKLHDIRDLDVDGDGVVEGDAAGSRVGMGLSEALAGARDGMGLEALKGQRAAKFRVRANNRDYYLAGSELTLKGLITTETWEHNPVFGVRYHTDRIRRLQWHDLFTQASDGSWSEPATSPLGSDGNRREETESTALFIENEMVNGPWIIRPGIRYEFLELNYEDFTEDGTNQRIIQESGNKEVWSAGIAATYLVSEERAVFCNLYRGFSVPGPRAVVRNGIEEETSTSAELGVRLRGKESRFAAELVAFYTHYEDLIVIDNIGSGSGGSTDQQPVTENVGAVDSFGVEFLVNGELYQDPNGGWTIPASLTATWTVAELDGDSTSTNAESIFAGGTDGNRLPYIPEFAINVSIGINTDRWTTGVSVSWRDKSFSTATETDDQINPTTGNPDARFGRIDSVFVVDWNFHYRLTETASLFATVTNIFDREFLVSRHPHGPRPGPPRQVAAGVTFSF